MSQRKRPENRQYVMSIRLTPKLRRQCLKAAEARGMLLSQFLRHAAALVAGMIPGGGTVTILSDVELKALEERHAP